VSTFVTGAFIDGKDLGFFPEVKSRTAVRAPVLGFLRTVVVFSLEKIVTDFAAKLKTFFAIIEVDVFAGGIAVRAPDRV